MTPTLTPLAMALLAAGPASAMMPPDVSNIVIPQSLGAEIKWLESLVGPAFKVDIEGVHNIYKVGDCDLGVQIEGGKIAGFDMAVSGACAFDLAKFMTNAPPPPVMELTFGSFDAATGGNLVTYQADCLTSCGNAADPVIYATWEGGRADNLINVVLGAKQVEDAAFEAGFAWEKTIEAAEGQDYVIDTRFNCDGKYNDVARPLMAKVKPDWIAVGQVSAPGISCTSTP
jgi:hypothetical protein